MNISEIKIKYKTETKYDSLQIVAYADKKKVGSLTIADQYVDDEESEYSYPFGAYVKEPFFKDITNHEYVINIEDLHIEKEYQKIGVASELMKRAMAVIKSRYSNVPIYINASPYGYGSNIDLDTLITFYKKFGFTVLKKYSQHRNALLWRDNTVSVSSSLKIHRRILAALKLVLSESVLTLWHGGNLELGQENIAHKGSRWEHGPGLYLTTHYDTARKYSKGSRKLYRIVIKKGTNIRDANIPISEALSFVDGYVIKSKRKEILSRIEARSQNGAINADTFLNIIINENAIKNTDTYKLRIFLVKQGVDYSIVDNAFGWGERMIVLFNMRNIVSKTIIKPKDKIENYDLPTDFTETTAGKKSNIIKIYRGESSSSENKGKGGIGFWSIDPEFAVQFTQTGQMKEVMTRKIDLDEIYDATKDGGNLPSANSEREFDLAMEVAKKKGYYGVKFSEGRNQPDSFYIFDKKAFK